MYKYNSKEIIKDDIYICLPGGEKYIEEAHKNGAKKTIKMSRPEMAKFASKLYGAPSKELKVIGITGTNGKTTITYLIAQALVMAGYKPYVLGTINSELTTPESLDIQRIMAKHLATGGTHFVMEVSSHGIDQGRINEIEFDVKALTNITQDHLGYHKTFENYKNTKLSFMKESETVKIYPENYKKVELPFKHPLPGRFNYENLQTAYLALKGLNISEEIIKKALSKAQAPPGRFENIDEGQLFYAIVDYAHTPDGLENVLTEAKNIALDRQGKVLVVFGCGGDRDRKKRPKMGKVVNKYADYFVITQDNPRSEDWTQITDDILEGLDLASSFKVIHDRREAIMDIIKKAEEKDVVMIAGKGHEDYQILANGKIHFDDREEVRLAIRRKLDASIN